MKLKFVCLNVWQGGNLMDDILKFIDKQKPDVLALQEAYGGSDPNLEPKYRTLKVIQEKFNFPYGDFAPEILDNRAEGNIQQGQAVFSKFPIARSNITFFNEPYDTQFKDEPANWPSISRNLQHVVLTTKAGEINVFNFHGPWDLDGDNYGKRRQNMTKTILDSIADKPKVILCGDTNATPTNKCIRDIEAHLTNVFKDELITTFNMRRKDNPGYATAVVDMIFVSSDIEVADHACPDVDISDHLPLTASLVIKA